MSNRWWRPASEGSGVAEGGTVLAVETVVAACGAVTVNSAMRLQRLRFTSEMGQRSAPSPAHRQRGPTGRVAPISRACDTLHDPPSHCGGWLARRPGNRSPDMHLTQ
jgi:hypothetical protein